MRDVTGTRRRKLVPAAGLAVVAAAGVFLTACDNDGAGINEAQDSSSPVSANPDDAALVEDMPESRDSAPRPTPGSAPVGEDAGDGAEGGSPQPDPAPQAPASGAPAQPQRVELADYTVPLNGQDSMICMFREDQEADGFDWGCQAENFHADWQATRGGQANGVAYREGGDPELYGLLGNAAGINHAGDLDDGSVTTVGDRFTVDLTQPDVALITVDGETARITADSYEMVG